MLKLLNETIWLTGLPCSGKTTIANKLKKELEYFGYNIVTLDGDEIRSGLSSDLKFESKDIEENIRRVSYICKMLNNKGFIVIASFVTPTEQLRDLVKKIIDCVKIIYAECSIKECMSRDVKGMYKKALSGEIKDFIGIQKKYEPPISPYIVVNTEENNAGECVQKIMNKIEKDGDYYNKK